jgi:hypothetical protein
MASGDWTTTTSFRSFLAPRSFEVCSLSVPLLVKSDQARKGHKYIRPRAIHDAEVVEEYAREYMYFACIQFINSVRPVRLAVSAFLTTARAGEDSITQMAFANA